MIMRIGIGYDVHRLVPGRKLWLGGVQVPFSQGLSGHSDADVLLHAIMDALLGAAAAGDIGALFPDTDPRYEGIESLVLLSEVASRIHALGYAVVNIDSVIVAQQPKLSPYLPGMRGKIAEALDIPCDNVSIKATTEEGLGFTGAGEGMAAKAVALIERR